MDQLVYGMTMWSCPETPGIKVHGTKSPFIITLMLSWNPQVWLLEWIQLNTQYFPVVMINMLYEVVLNIASVD